MVEKQKLPKLDFNLVVDNTLFNDVLEVNWSKWNNSSLKEVLGDGFELPPTKNTSEFRLSVVKLDSALARLILRQNSPNIINSHHNSNIFPKPEEDLHPVHYPITSDPFSIGEPIWSGVFPGDSSAVRIQLSERASELDGKYLGFILKFCKERGSVGKQALMIIRFKHTPYFSCSPTSSAANFIRKESFRWPLSMLEKFNKIPCLDIKTVVNEYKAVYFAMSLISSSPYDWDSTNKIKDDCYCFEYDNNAYLISKEFWLLYEIMLDTKNSQTDEKLHDQGMSNLAVKLLEDQLEDIWNRKYFYKVESIPAAVLKWESFPNADSYSVQRFSKKRDCLCPIVKNQKATTCEDLNYNDTIHYELNTGTKVYKYECAPSLSPIVV